MNQDMGRVAVRSVAIALAVQMLVGCAGFPDSALRPSIPDFARLPFVDQAWVTVNGKAQEAGQSVRALTLDDYKDVLRKLLGKVMLAAEKKNTQAWDFGLTTLVGGAAATVGVLAHRTGLTNTGLGTAGLGQLEKTYYTPQPVRDSHLGAYGKLSCIATEIGTLSEVQRLLAMESGKAGTAEAGEALPDIAHSVDAVLTAYRKQILGMAPPEISRDDMLRFVSEYQQKTTQSDTAQKAAAADTPVTDQVVKPAETASAPKGGSQTDMAKPVEQQSSASTNDQASKATLPQRRDRYAARFYALKVKLEACTKL